MAFWFIIDNLNWQQQAIIKNTKKYRNLALYFNNGNKATTGNNQQTGILKIDRTNGNCAVFLATTMQQMATSN